MSVPTRLIDTHLHLVYRDSLVYPWLGSEPTLAAHDWTYELYAAEAHPLGVTDCLHMEVDVVEADIDREIEFIRDLAGGPVRHIRAAISNARPEHAGFAQQVERACADPFIRGFRRILHVVPDEVSRTRLFRENVGRLAGTGLTFDICVRPDQLGIAAELVDACPGVAFVLDHCGGGSASRPDLFATWKTALVELARRPGVVAKVSGVIGTVADGWTVDDLRPVVETTIEAFGWDRVVWGSDWPWSAQRASLTDWIEATWRLVESASETEREKLFHRNATRIYGIG
ncbi:amidohydrolase [Pleomorphomonas diazotrophica]|uniref:Amidohydrolase n=1 Tax=Pleomorphomonas diazotrophica TaxID=1166257 RepID=A0A1I4SVL1_9HYPH|nr:amidohydrolase family protein [Pleomorphomonas diazotrophica]PKR88556.1 amidohydrolase [Pleomorphomonas diazotrophica]SFM68323.1 Predicted metal-dependent hydrolase, TIM-barrel fold [Pleomorphomonas diazotrophica]